VIRFYLSTFHSSELVEITRISEQLKSSNFAAHEANCLHDGYLCESLFGRWTDRQRPCGRGSNGGATEEEHAQAGVWGGDLRMDEL
jgi:hypothetical protein